MPGRQGQRRAAKAGGIRPAALLGALTRLWQPSGVPERRPIAGGIGWAALGFLAGLAILYLSGFLELMADSPGGQLRRDPYAPAGHDRLLTGDGAEEGPGCTTLTLDRTRGRTRATDCLEVLPPEGTLTADARGRG